MLMSCATAAAVVAKRTATPRTATPPTPVARRTRWAAPGVFTVSFRDGPASSPSPVRGCREAPCRRAPCQGRGVLPAVARRRRRRGSRLGLLRPLHGFLGRRWRRRGHALRALRRLPHHRLADHRLARRRRFAHDRLAWWWRFTRDRLACHRRRLG